MLFHSYAFLFFFPVVVCLYFLAPFRFRWVLLLAASYVFYGWWRIEYLGLIALSTVIDYISGLAMGAQPEKKKRWLWLSLAANLGLLGWFKYASFFNESARGIAHWLGMDYPAPILHILLPVGISFYTFQSLSYTIDVYRGHREPERHFGIFALYVAFFPQLVAGPIERSTQLLPQFRERHAFTWDNLTAGLRLMVVGYFLKLVIADRIAPYIDTVYANPGHYEGITVAIAADLFMFQLFGDFAGYSYIAIGAAQIMGYRLMENFRRPYFARSVSQYWREWNISLSTWFRDYVYIALGGNRKGPVRRLVNLILLFTISGLWHGAKWNMIWWGFAHGVVMAMEALGRDHLPKRLPQHGIAGRLTAGIQIFVTFHFISLAAIFFRADSMGDAVLVTQRLFAGLTNPDPLFVVTGTPLSLAISFGFIFLMQLFQYWQGDRELGGFLATLPRYCLWPLIYFLLFSTLVFGAFREHAFIYFQF